MASSPLTLLGARLGEAAAKAWGAEVAVPDPLVVPTRDRRHGDYTCAAALAVARPLGQPPAVLAQRLVDAADLADVCEAPEVVRPGFVNLRLRPGWLSDRVAAAIGDESVGVDAAAEPARVVVDYSGPNMAKEMHVGHLRSTILGDCLANVLELLGHQVERVSHVGDWGTQFGMLVAHLEDVRPQVLSGPGEPGEPDLELGDLVAFYQAAKVRFDTDRAFGDRARRRVVDLQSGAAGAAAAWRALVGASRRENRLVYERLGVEGLVERGESTYQPGLAQVVADLVAAGLAVVDDGATCVFVEGFTNAAGEPLPLIVQKADGGYTYATTDLAAVRHRVEAGADRLVYVVDAGQSQHLEMVFAVARRAGWLPPGVTATHVAFGLVLGAGGKRLRTRSGQTVRLRDLLDEAVARARAFLDERAAEREEPLPPDADGVAQVVGIGAVKYADLSQNRQSNYVFSYDRMLSLKGNTAPYLMYAHARIRSILGEAGAAPGAGPGRVEVVLHAPQELELAKRLVEVGDVCQRVAAELAPNHLCAYLYDLSQAYNQFYEHCPVLQAGEPDLRASRLALCQVTAATLRRGLALLGIGAPARI
ncbi:MAG: arginine--tRNA ligase [Acidimicrobiales bacterium]